MNFNKKGPNCLYRMKNSDLILTGGHSLLVDDLSENEINNNSKYGFSSSILDKKLLLACSSDNFEVEESNENPYELYHIVLENDDIYGHYGIYINDGILSESCSENEFIKIFNK